jgi:hypothetical protein
MLTFISVHCYLNYIHCSIFLTNAVRYISLYYANKVYILYVGQTLDVFLRQMDPIHTTWFSYADFNIIPQVLLHLSLHIQDKCCTPSPSIKLPYGDGNQNYFYDVFKGKYNAI